VGGKQGVSTNEIMWENHPQTPSARRVSFSTIELGPTPKGPERRSSILKQSRVDTLKVRGGYCFPHITAIMRCV
jgi:hypothetical protein